MKRMYLFLLTILLFSSIIFAQPQHFTFTGNTGDSYSIVIDNATLNGTPLSNGDEIGVFTPAGLCVGASVWTGTTPLGLTAWIDDSQTPATDGYTAGEAMSFKIWDASDNKEYAATANYSKGNGNFGDGGYSQLTLTAGTGPTESITITTPNGGENLEQGSQFEIQWTSSNFTGNVHIEYSSDGGSTYSDVIASTDDDGSHMWTVPTVASQNCQMKISDAADGDPFDLSDGFFTISSGPSPGGAIIVNNTEDSGMGSFRDAINQANTNTGPDSIIFQIPKGDPGYDTNIGVWTITPQSVLPAITDGDLLVDGFSQAVFVGEDTNPYGPEIQFDGTQAGVNCNGLEIRASGVQIVGLIIHNFSHAGISFWSAQYGVIAGCFIGCSYDGLSAAPNEVGIWFYQTKWVHIMPADTLPNIISGNNNCGIFIQNSSNHNFILGNFIGLDATMVDTLGNALHGICMQDSCDSNEVVDNRICGNWNGVYLSESSGNVIANNLIGRHEDPEIQLGNIQDGIQITNHSQNNKIMENLIGHNGRNGVFVLGNKTIHNFISRNSITHNEDYGIENRSGGNNELSPPQIQTVTSSSISGTAPPYSMVEIFYDQDNEGEFFIGETQADASGNFSWSGEITSEFYITATATDADSNTSQFSDPVKYTSGVKEESLSAAPITFSLHQNYPNPFNPYTKIRYELPRSSYVRLTILNMLGQELVTMVDEQKNAGRFSIQWDGTDRNGVPLAGGIYLYRISAGEFTATRKLILMK